ncbi:unnamed protein product [Medioppia subpectinata]|uniref:Uncharacterized protein n=1 Tax=Medioppia subpectinata TaxID=1979941 RepID=A0A7R9KIV4_9ACAR|nr:unnamed protein product [Medioppia subpectinata]CAG2104077.1 unnamed protein product [Medioppia subpectinata]
MHHNFNIQKQTLSSQQRERQSQPNKWDSKDAYTAGASAIVSPPPPWIRDLKIKNREKLIDIVNSGANGVPNGKFDETSEKFVNSVNSLTNKVLATSDACYVSSDVKSGKTSIGSSTSPTTTPLQPLVRQSEVNGALSESWCQSCQSCQSCLLCSSECHHNHYQTDYVPIHWESGFHAKKCKAVHLNSASSGGVNVPIVRSVSSSVVTGRSCSRCLVNTCLDCLKHLKTTLSVSDFASNDCPNISNSITINTQPNGKCCTSGGRLAAHECADQQIIPGLVAQRKIEILQRQVSESSFFGHPCCVCGNTSNDINASVSVTEKMIGDKSRDKSDYIDTQRHNHHYEVIMDSVHKVVGKSNGHPVGNGKGGDEGEYEYQYGPGIVHKLKHKFMTISTQQQNNHSIHNRLKRFSSLENISLTNNNDSTHYPLPNHCQHLNHNHHNSQKPSLKANEMVLPLNGKNGAQTVGSVTDSGNRANGSQQLSQQRLYIQHHNSKNLYNSRSSAAVPAIKRAKSMETLSVIQDDSERGRQPLNSTPNHQLLSPKTETPLTNQTDLQHILNDNVLIQNSRQESHKSQRNAANGGAVSQSIDMKSVGNRSNHNNINNTKTSTDDELPKPDTVKTFKKIFEPVGASLKTTTTGDEINGKISANHMNSSNKLKNNYKKSQMNGSSVANVKRKPPVIRATNRSVQQKSLQPISSTLPVNSSPTIKSQSSQSSVSSLPQVIHTTPSVPMPANRSTIPKPSDNDKNNNSNKSAINSNTSSIGSSVQRKPPIAPKRASLTLKANPLTGMSAAAIQKQMKPNGTNATNNCNKVAKHLNNNHFSADNKIIEKSVKMKSSDEVMDGVVRTTTSSIDTSVAVTTNGSDEMSTVCPNNQSNATNSTLDWSEGSTNKSRVNKPIANIKPFTQENNETNGDLMMERPNDNQSAGEEQQSLQSECHHLGHDIVVTDNEASTPVNGIANNARQVVDNNIVINNKNNKSNKNDNELNGTIISTAVGSEGTVDVKQSIVNDENVSPNSCDINVDNNHNKSQSNAGNDRIADHSITQTTVDVLKPSYLLNTENNGSTKSQPNSSLWTPDAKKSNNSSANSMVFDFRGKDVKSNLAIHPVPFGAAPVKRAVQNGTTGEADDGDDDCYTGCTDTPPPSGIVFAGENVRVGRGAILSNRNKKLTLQFNDSLTKTFEYPSEASLMQEMGLSTTSGDDLNGENKSETNNSVITSESNNANTSLTAFKTNLALGGSQGSLGSYKPTVIETPFELGVSSRAHKTNSTSDMTANDDNNHSTDTSTTTDLIKPATPDETSSWSTSSTASDLLF